MVAEQRISWRRDGVDLSIMADVMGAKDRSRSESASSITRWDTRERMLGSDSAMLARRCGVEIRMSTPPGEKRRFRMTRPL